MSTLFKNSKYWLPLTIALLYLGGPGATSLRAEDEASEVPAPTSSPASAPPTEKAEPEAPKVSQKKSKESPDSSQDVEDTFEKKRFSLNVSNGEMRDVLQIIAARGGLDLRLESTLSGKINVRLKNTTLAEALDQLAEDNALEYLIDGDRMTVKKLAIGSKSTGRFSGASANSRSPSSVDNAANLSANVSQLSNGTTTTGVREIALKYATASKILEQIGSLISKTNLVIADELANSIIFQGSDVDFNRIADVVKTLDRLPQQVLIEAQIVETSRNFLQAFGLNWGLTQDPNFSVTKSKLGFVSNANGPGMPTGALRYAIGDWGGVPLDVRISAAETNGDAKVISRPRVVTLNNTPAKIDSGIQFNVKTLAAVAGLGVAGGGAGGGGAGGGGGGGGLGMAAGGVATLKAGLTLDVTPTIMGKELVKLSVIINNRQPDESQIVDGIPGIVNNSANTTVIVTEGRTAVIAGLVKNTGGRAVASVPFFANIPIVGALFRNSNVSDRNNELVIFITPQIVTPQQDLKPERAFGEPKLSAPSTEGTPGT